MQDKINDSDELIIQRHEPSVSQPLSEPHAIEQKLNIQSQFHAQYIAFFKDMQINQNDISALTKTMFDKEEIRYDPDHFEQNLICKIIQHMPNYQIVTLQIQISFLRFSITVYCEDNESRSHCFPCKESRIQSTIYLVKTQNTEEAIKCYCRASNKNYAKVFSMALKQYCFLKIAHALSVGLKPIKSAGFDLIIYKNCIEFSLQKCKQIDDVQTQLTQEDIISLKKKLYTLHNFRIMHLDIKTMNVMYSPIKKELIFIDFGFSRVVEQKAGLKTSTNFLGSVNYASPQMVKLFSSEQAKAYVDLYYNDIYCLNTTINELEDKIKQNRYNFEQEQNNTQQNDNIFDNGINKDDIDKFTLEQLKYRIKYAIFYREEYLWNHKNYIQALIKHGNHFMNFILQFSFNNYINNIYQFIVSRKANISEAQIHRKRMEFKRSNLQKNIGIHLINFYQKYQQNLFQLKLEYAKNIYKGACNCYGQKVVTFIKQNIKENLYIMLDNKKSSKHEILLQLIRFLDLQSCISDYNQKIDAYTYFNTFLDFQAYKTILSKKNNFPELIQRDLYIAFRYILDYFLEKWQNGFEEAISTAIINLILINGISLDQISQIICEAMNNKKSRQKVSLLLFRIGFIKDWIQYKYVKTMTKYQVICLQRILISKCKQLLQVEPLNDFILIIYNLLEIGAVIHGNISEVQYYLQRCKSKKFQYESQLLTELILFKIYAQHKRFGNKSAQSRIHLYKYLNDTGLLLNHKYEKVDAIYLRFVNMYPGKIRKMISFKYYQKFCKCLEQAAIHKQFYFYYKNLTDLMCDQRSLQKIWTNSEYKNAFNDMLKMMQSHNLQNVNQSAKWLYNFLQNIDQISVISLDVDYKDKIKAVIEPKINNYTELFNPDYIMMFLNTANYLCRIFYISYQQNDYEVLSGVLSEFITKIAEKIEFLNDEKQIISCQHILNKSRLTIYIHQSKQQGLNLCRTQIQYLLGYRQKYQSKYASLEEYIGQMILLITKIGSQKCRDSAQWLYSIIKKHNLYKIALNGNLGFVSYEFLTNFTLSHPRYIEEYFNFQKILMDIAFQHPYEIYRTYYKNFLQQKFPRYNQLFLHKDIFILQRFLYEIKRNKWNNPYISVFFSFFINIISKKDTLNMMIVKICQEIDKISVNIRKYVLRKLSIYIFHSKFFQGPSKFKIRKMRLFLSYMLENIATSINKRKFRKKMRNKKLKNELPYKMLTKKLNALFSFHS